MKKSNQEETRQHNCQLVLSTIYQEEEISRVDISRRTGLTRTTVSEIVANHIESGLVYESGFSPSTGGKPAILLRFDENSRLLIGIDLAEREFRGALVNLRGEIIHRVHIPIGDADGKEALEFVYSLIQQLLDQAEQTIIGIGIGTPGLMDPSTGLVRQAINLNWQELPLAENLSQRFELPIHIANDCQVAALGEFTFGEKNSSDHMILIKAGRGIGAGIILGGRPFFGDSAGAGEIGHIKVRPDGETCRCGNRGCLETIFSERALVRDARQLVIDHPGTVISRLVSRTGELTVETLIKAYKDKDLQVVALVDETARTLGSVIAHLVGALNIHHILIAGSLSLFGPGLLGPVRQAVRTGILPGLAPKIEIGFSTLADDIVIQGAASLILKNELGLL